MFSERIERGLNASAGEDTRICRAKSAGLPAGAASCIERDASAADRLLEIPVDTEAGFIGQRDFGNRDLDEHLLRRGVELRHYRTRLLEFARAATEKQPVAAGVHRDAPVLIERLRRRAPAV
jgi:hypothetical protein